MTTRGADLQDYLLQLGRAYGFTLDQLEANRAGLIHPAQLARGRASGVARGAMLLILAIAALSGGAAGASALHDELRPPISQVDMNGVYALVAAGVLVAITLGAAALATLLGVRQRRGIYARGELCVVEGPAHKIHIHRRGGAGDTRLCRVGDRTFPTQRSAWDLITQGAQYRAYFAGSDLLSIEPGPKK